MKKKTNAQLAFFIARVALGVNFLFHGVARLGKVNQFAEGVASGFQETILPQALAYGYGLLIPYIELIFGLLILLGVFTRFSLFVMGLFMSTLILGMCLQQQWGTVGTQMIYIIVIFLLLYHEEHNCWYLKQ